MLTSSVQNQIAFKTLFGKSQTNPNFDLVNEADSYFLNTDSRYVWLDHLTTSATQSINDGFAIPVTGVMSEIKSSEKRACYTLWPGIPPSGTDIKTGQAFVYGFGSLAGISAGDRITNVIPDSYGTEYEAKPYVTTVNDILPLDPRDWVYQYNSGIYYQNTPSDGVNYLLPSFVRVYVYSGRILNQSNGITNVRVSFTGTNTYSATSSSPTITNYSGSHTYVSDFPNANTSTSVNININGIGTYSLYKYDTTGLVSLNPGDIQTSGVYFLKYDSDIPGFVFYTSNPNSDSSKFVNPSLSLDSVGGIQSGSSFDTKISDVLNGLVYPEQVGQISSFGFQPTIPTIEVGDTMSLATYTLGWHLSNTSSFGTNTISIYDSSEYSPTETYWGPGGLVATSVSNSLGTYSVSLGTYSSSFVRSRDFRMSIKRNDGTTVTKTASVDWMYPFYIGTSTYSSLDSTQVSSLTKTLSDTSSGDWEITGTYGYKYLGIPSTYSLNTISYKGLPVAIADSSDLSGVYTYSTSSGVGYSLMTVTNSFGVAIDYNIYRTVNQISGTFTVTIN